MFHHVIHQIVKTHNRMDCQQFQPKLEIGFSFSHYLVHRTVRDEETTVVSFFFLKIQPNNACQEAGMTFGAVKAIKRL